MHASFSFHYSNLQLAYITQAWISKFKTYAMQANIWNAHSNASYKFMSLLPLFVCSKFQLIHFLLSYLSSYVKFSPYHLYLYFSSPLCCLFTYLCALSLPLCHLCLCFTYIFVSLPFHYLFTLSLCTISPPLSSMTTKVQNIDNTTCRVEIINVNQWGEDHFSKFGLI